MSRRDARTYGDLLTMTHAHTAGTCRFCKSWKNPMHTYTIRCNICVPCIEARKDEVMAHILKAEGKARRYLVKNPDMAENPAFLMALSGATLDYCKSICTAAVSS